MRKKLYLKVQKQRHSRPSYRNNLPYFKSEQKQIEILFVHEGSSLRKHVNIECKIKNNLGFFNKITQINEINIKHI